jgi:hypothetical protein
MHYPLMRKLSYSLVPSPLQSLFVSFALYLYSHPPHLRARRHGRTYSSVLCRAKRASSYVLLSPRDKDHYSPLLDLERTLYTIIERERLESSFYPLLMLCRLPYTRTAVFFWNASSRYRPHWDRTISDELGPSKDTTPCCRSVRWPALHAHPQYD